MLATFAVCGAFVVVLCGYLYVVSSQLRRIANNLGDVNDMVTGCAPCLPAARSWSMAHRSAAAILHLCRSARAA